MASSATAANGITLLASSAKVCGRFFNSINANGAAASICCE
jgi:hypothetical protein